MSSLLSRLITKAVESGENQNKQNQKFLKFLKSFCVEFWLVLGFGLEYLCFINTCGFCYVMKYCGFCLKESKRESQKEKATSQVESLQ